MQYIQFPKTLIVGFGHKARQGKDTATSVFLDYFGGDARTFSFADDLYAVCRIVYGMKAKDAPLLQRIGTNYRHDNPNVWIDSVYLKICDKLPRLALIPDVRYRNEAKFIRDMGGVLIKLERFNKDGSRYIATDRPADHPSEIDLDEYRDWDHVIQADSVGLLEYQAHLLAELIGKELGYAYPVSACYGV